MLLYDRVPTWEPNTMMSCPICGEHSLASIEILYVGNAVSLAKTDDLIQLCCQECGWMDFWDKPIMANGEKCLSTMGASA